MKEYAMSRLLYESDFLHHLEDTYHDLQAYGIANKDLHVVSNHDGKILRHGLNAANSWYRTDVVHVGVKGLTLGLMMGVALALILAFSNIPTQYYGTSGFILTILFCTGFGSWIGGFIGLQNKNHKLKKYFNYVEEGKYLLLIDTNEAEIDKLHLMMKNRHPQLKLLSDDVETAIPIPLMQTIH